MEANGVKQTGFLNLRFAFFLPCLLLVAVPVIGYLEIERTSQLLAQLIQQQTKSQLSAAVVQVIEHPRVAEELAYITRHIRDNKTPIFVSEVSHSPPSHSSAAIEAPTLDARATEWSGVPRLTFGVDELVQINAPFDLRSLTTEIRLMQSERYLYMFVDVMDDEVVYREISNISIHRNDHIRLSMMDRDGFFARYTIATEQPGAVYAAVVSTGGRALRPEPRIEGFWRATSSGYRVELRIDRVLFQQQLAINIADVDDPLTREIQFLQGSGYTDQPDGLSTLIGASKPLSDLLLNTPLLSAQFIDRFGNLLADVSGIKAANTSPIQEHPSAVVTDRIEQIVIADGVVLGTLSTAVDLSQVSSYRIESQQQLFKVTAAIFAVGLLISFVVSQLVLTRLRRLGDELENTVDEQGRVQSPFVEKHVGQKSSAISDSSGESRPDQAMKNDAIHDLRRKFVSITLRLHQYNEYLEQLSRRLAHELRTPVSVVRSSLENLEDRVDEDSNKFVERAKNGIARLTNILNSMSEATRIEQSLNKDDLTVFELSHVLAGCVDGYQQAFQSQTFELIVEAKQSKITGIPDLFAQLLDKLIDNAVQFSEDDQPIVLRLTNSQEFVTLRISNGGAALPDTMEDQLFDPMVSLRKRNKSGSSHLGLGLYIAKIITEFHGGEIKLNNREDRQGAVVTIRLPLMRLSSKLA